MFLLAANDFISLALALVIGGGLGLLIAKRKKFDFSKIIYLKSEEFRLNMRRGQLIDIRSEENFTKEKINGARNFPKNSVLSKLNVMRTDQPIFIYDEYNTKRVTNLARKLIKKGYQPIYILADGLHDWPYPKK